MEYEYDEYRSIIGMNNIPSYSYSNNDMDSDLTHL